MTDNSIDRLEKRLTRERRARETAEQIAERTLRTLYLANRNLELLAQVAAVANQSSSADEVLRDTLPILVELGPWDIGLACLIEAGATNDRDPQLIASHRFGNPDRIPKAGTGNGRAIAAPTADISSKALVEPIWVADFTQTPFHFGVENLAEGSACAFPLMTENGAAGSIVLLSPTKTEADEGFRDRAGIIGQQLGAVVDRELRVADREAAQQRLAAQVESRTQELVRERSREHAAARSRESLQATLSHELLTPLHAISNAVDSAKENATPEMQPLCNIVSDSASRLTNRVNQLMDLMDYTAGEVIAVEALPASVLTPSLDDYNRLLRSSARPITMTVDPSADQELIFDRSAVVAAFEASVALVLANSTDMVTVRINLSGGNLMMTISASAAERTSDPSIAAQIVSTAGGSIAESVTNDTYQVTARIPAIPSGPPRHGQGHRVLLVDDTEVARHLGSGIVRSLGLAVDTAADGIEAIDALTADHNYALVLMDIGMPRLDGYETTRAIRAGQAGSAAANLPIVALTALTSDADQLRSQLAGMDDFISKPFSKADLAATVKRFIVN